METWRDVWSDMSYSDRELAARCLWSQLPADSETIQRTLDFLASTLRFRRRRLQGLPTEQRARMLARAGSPPEPIAQAALLALHFGERRSMLVAFLDNIGVPHKEGQIDWGENPTVPVAEDVLKRGLLAIAEQFPRPDVELYRRCLLQQDPTYWAGLRAARLDSEPTTGTGVVADAPAPEMEVSLEEEAVRGADPTYVAGHSFDTLDRVLIHAIVASVAGTTGALLAEQVRDLVDQVIHLNSDRQSAYFHLGFLEVLQGQAPAFAAPEATDARRRWYLVGALSGYIRRGAWPEAEVFVRQHSDDFRAVGTGSHEAGSLVVDLLMQMGEKTRDLSWVLGHLGPVGLAAAGFGAIDVLVGSSAGLIAERRAEEAMRLLGLASAACEMLSEQGHAVPSDLRRDISRRLAHCLRLQGSFEQAQAELEAILAAGAGSREGMVRADIGIVACRLRALEEVRLPADEADCGAVARSLEPGAARFAEATECRGRAGGHGEYCLGVYYLAKRLLLQRHIL